MTAEAQLQLHPAVAGGQPASESRPEEQVHLDARCFRVKGLRALPLTFLGET
jgi:hypothetical protein